MCSYVKARSVHAGMVGARDRCASRSATSAQRLTARKHSVTYGIASTPSLECASNSDSTRSSTGVRSSSESTAHWLRERTSSTRSSLPSSCTWANDARSTGPKSPLSSTDRGHRDDAVVAELAATDDRVRELRDPSLRVVAGVPDERDPARGPQHPGHLGQRNLVIEPVKRLRARDDVRGAVRQRDHLGAAAQRGRRRARRAAAARASPRAAPPPSRDARAPRASASACRSRRRGRRRRTAPRPRASGPRRRGSRAAPARRHPQRRRTTRRARAGPLALPPSLRAYPRRSAPRSPRDRPRPPPRGLRRRQQQQRREQPDRRPALLRRRRAARPAARNALGARRRGRGGRLVRERRRPGRGVPRRAVLDERKGPGGRLSPRRRR